MRWFLTFLMCLLISLQGFAQHDITTKIAFNNLVNPTTNLFVHFDKNVYSNNETVYFTAYILKTGKFNLNDHKILAVTLIRDADTSLIKSDKFMIQQGLAFGNMVIPDSVVTGNYQLLAYTDKLVNGKPELIFNQPITIKTNIELPFRANIKLIEKADINANENKVLISVTTNDHKFLSKPVSVHYKYGNLQKAEKTDASGQLLLNLPKQENLIDPNIHVRLKHQKDSSFLSIPLPAGKIKPIVKFFPESGNLVTNITSTISWEVTDLQKRPIALTAFLLKNNSPIDTIETSSYGIGKFKLYAEENAVYTVKLADKSFADSIYNLPKAIGNGLVINIEKAVVQDTLSLILKNSGNLQIFIRLHNFKKCFLAIPFDMESDIRKLKIPLTDVPKGLHTITITDSLDRPLAERLFFAHYSNQEVLSLSTDKNSYKQREKVSLKLKTKGIQENSIVSIAVVQENRMTLKNTNDIESYAYITNELTHVAPNGKSSIYKDQDYLEQILRTKGWRRYTWQQVHTNKPSDTLSTIDSLQIVGNVKRNRKPLQSPINLTTLGDSTLRVITTSANGNFNFHTPDMISQYGKKMYLFVNASNKENYEIEVTDGFDSANRNLSKTEIQFSPEPVLQANNADLILKRNEKAIRLKEVIITKNDNSRFHHTRGGSGANACGDYVCMYDILNCRNHIADAGNTQPIAGVTYQGGNGPYQECKNYAKDDKSYVEFAGIRYHKEFYLDDYKDPLEPAFFSTLYWNYGTILNPEKEIELNFHTSDITGVFKVIVQGITKDDVIYSEKKFEVKNMPY